jgi:hypothetical protein
MHQSSPEVPDRTRPDFSLARNLRQQGDCGEANDGLSVFVPNNEPVHKPAPLPAAESLPPTSPFA